MATKKIMSAFVAALVCVCGIVFMTSCEGSEEIKETQAKPETEYIDRITYIDRDKLVNIMNNVYFDGENMTINNTVGLHVDINHTYPTIEMPAADHAAAIITDSNDLRWSDTNGQLTTGTLNITPSRDNSYFINATLTPAENYSTIKSLHPKVSLITTQHNLNGDVATVVDGTTQSKDFSFKLNRSYLLVDPSVDTKIINTTDTLIQVEVRVDTLINTVEVHDTVTIVNNVEVIKHDTITVTNTVTVTDTLTVEVEKFVKGADINKSVVNDFGYSVGTLTLGDKRLLQVTLRHAEPVLNVTKEQLGNASFAGAGNLVWNGTDTQVTTGTKDANNVTVKSFDFVRCEYTKVSETMYIVRTIYNVTGSFYNENSDLCEFSMELAPSYLQKYEAPAEPAIVTPETTKYRGIIRSLSVDGLKLMTKPVLQTWNSTSNAWEDVKTFKRACVGMSGSPSGLDLFVKGKKILEETENSWWYTGEDATWTGDDPKSDGVIVSKRTKVYEFNHMFEADAVANGKVGPATQLYVMRAEKVQLPDPDGNMLTCTWEDGSDFSLNLNVVLNDTKFEEKAEMIGQTRTESDKTYKYLTSFVQHFTASIGGKNLQDVYATSTLWVPAE